MATLIIFRIYMQQNVSLKYKKPQENLFQYLQEKLKMGLWESVPTIYKDGKVVRDRLLKQGIPVGRRQQAFLGINFTTYVAQAKYDEDWFNSAFPIGEYTRKERDIVKETMKSVALIYLDKPGCANMKKLWHNKRGN
eukprot:TRINITY_DN120189_c0_g1_i1.p8 TRINITY_DN120189_c0_g1~~TRINITY_DN120189_c0_g1_i1.p8  ORF type:complete len:137 (-),score=0.64 TRINITY_DN120189_c0_g1_i1:907-1317(-)